jgi:hypothetical protein
MAFLSSIGGIVVAQNKQIIAQQLCLDKKTVALATRFIRDNTKECVKPLLVVGACTAAYYGLSYVRTEIIKRRREQLIAPTPLEIENLTHTANSVDSNCGLDQEGDAELEPELEDCLENDPAASEDVRWLSADKEDMIVDLEIKERKYNIGLSDRGDKKLEADSDEEPPEGKSKKVKADSIISELKHKKVLIAQEAYRREQYRKQRKRVRSGCLSKAVKGLTFKIRASFPIPDGSMLQQKAMSLYAAKECRKMCIREAQIATIVPKAVALASIPTTSQVDLRQIVQIEPVQLKYNKMAWSGFKNKQGWLANLEKFFA